ncbi:max dimerization protein 3 isoform X2 [Chanodichthys erythropterus]|uniref:max dimerization protein 3 isoform X2 n=1 Tax=Chanodichthys erythropterus TaxID=933992 RepID=UPI00351E9B4A
MEVNTCNIQVLLQAAEYLERREREAEHGYASVLPFYSKGVSDKRKKQKSKSPSPGNSRSVHNELEKHRRAQLRHCLDQLKQQVPLSSDSSRNTTLNLLRQAQLHIKKRSNETEGLTVCLCATAEAAGTGRARGAAEGPSALGAGAAAHTAGETAGRFGEDAQRQPRISRVL